MVENLTIFVEGDPRLREGFNHLFSAHLKGRKVFNLSKGKSDALKKYNLDKKSTVKSVLVDLDRHEKDKEVELKETGLTGKPHVYYMVQEMEAWFLSQPEVLDGYFNLKLSEALKAKYGEKHATEIPNPKSKLKGFVKEKYQKREVIDGTVKPKTNYDEVDDAIVLLKKLNLSKLSKEFNDVENLIKLLN
ncbi:MAG TPA: DUF4276 family protein [Chitinophagales bacterium]|nr:DUF4276 family protein [Chitinophagales bacterium]